MLPALIGAGGALLGGLIQNQQNQASARESNTMNYEMAARQMDFQKEMSNTAHQRARKDLEAAGLNPILSANNGASTPSGASGNASAAKMENILSPAVSTAMEIKRLQSDIGETNSRIALNAMQGRAAAAAAENSVASAKQSTAATTRMETEMANFRKRLDVESSQLDIDKKMQRYDNIMKRVEQGMGVGNSALDMLMPKRFLPKIPGKSMDLPPDLGRTKDGEIFHKGTGEVFENWKNKGKNLNF